MLPFDSWSSYARPVGGREPRELVNFSQNIGNYIFFEPYKHVHGLLTIKSHMYVNLFKESRVHLEKWDFLICF
jgi:hypothetical protein